MAVGFNSYNFTLYPTHEPNLCWYALLKLNIIMHTEILELGHTRLCSGPLNFGLLYPYLVWSCIAM